MSYETVEDALVTQLRQISELAVSINDFTKIQNGAQKIAILRYGSFTQARFADRGIHHITWLVTVDTFCRYKNDVDTRNALRDLRNSIIMRVNAYPRLSDQAEIFDAFVVSGRALPEQVQLGGFYYLGETLTCSIIEEIDAGLQE